MDRLLVAGWDAGCIIKMSQLAAERSSARTHTGARRARHMFFVLGKFLITKKEEEEERGKELDDDDDDDDDDEDRTSTEQTPTKAKYHAT